MAVRYLATDARPPCVCVCFSCAGPWGGEAQGREALALLDELLGAAMERCSQPLLLEPAVLDRIVAGALAAQKQQQAPGSGAVSLL